MRAPVRGTQNRPCWTCVGTLEGLHMESKLRPKKHLEEMYMVHAAWKSDYGTRRRRAWCTLHGVMVHAVESHYSSQRWNCTAPWSRHDHVHIFSARHSALVNSATSGSGFRMSLIKFRSRRGFDRTSLRSQEGASIFHQVHPPPPKKKKRLQSSPRKEAQRETSGLTATTGAWTTTYGEELLVGDRR